MILPSPREIHEAFARIPTTDLYFRNPLRQLARLPGAPTLPPIRNLAPNVYSVGRTGVISRYASGADLDRLQKRGVERIVYIADDDFEAGAADPALPARYRAKLAAFVEGAWPLLTAAADIVIVSSPVLATIYGRKARTIEPVWMRPPAPTEHFSEPARIEIAHLGTGSHWADLAPLAPDLAALLHAHPNVRLTLFAGAEAPSELKHHPQVRSRRPMRWWLYKRMLPRMRFHLTLYPLRDTPFNAARSANKLYEQSIAGAASLMSPNPALREVVGRDLGAVFVEGGVSEWRRRIEEDIGDIAACRRRAEATHAQILRSDPLERAARQWLDILAAET